MSNTLIIGAGSGVGMRLAVDGGVGAVRRVD